MRRCHDLSWEGLVLVARPYIVLDVGLDLQTRCLLEVQVKRWVLCINDMS